MLIIIFYPFPGYESASGLSISPSAPPWQGRSIASSKLRMLEFSAFLEQPQDPENVSLWIKLTRLYMFLIKLRFQCYNILSTSLSLMLLLVVIWAVQQALVCAYWSVKPNILWPLFGGSGYPADLWQIPWEERRSEGAVWERTSKWVLPCQVLGKT